MRPVSRLFAGKSRDGEPLKGHRHAFYLPADEDGDGQQDTVDHVLPHARALLVDPDALQRRVAGLAERLLRPRLAEEARLVERDRGEDGALLGAERALHDSEADGELLGHRGEVEPLSDGASMRGDLVGAAQRLLSDVVEADPSPDGQRVAFVRFANETDSTRVASMGLFDVGSGVERQLRSERNVEFARVRWAPDGRSLAVIRRATLGVGTTAIVIVDPDSGDIVREFAPTTKVTPTSAGLRDGMLRALSNWWTPPSC